MTVVKSAFHLVLLAGAAAPGALHAQADAAGCMLVKRAYVCDWQVFRTRFEQARTVAVQPRPMERATERRLTELVQLLGKTLAAPGQPADIILRVVPADPAGIMIGPADQPLAKLEVLAPGSDGRPATLLWVETFVGQADRPWPLVVTALANQFQARFGHSRH